MELSQGEHSPFLPWVSLAVVEKHPDSVGHGLAGDRHLGYFPVLGSLPPRACARGRLSPALQCGHFGLDPSLFGGLSLAWGDVEQHACSSPTRCQ